MKLVKWSYYVVQPTLTYKPAKREIYQYVGDDKWYRCGDEETIPMTWVEKVIRKIKL